MLSIEKQLSKGYLVCPLTHSLLRDQGDLLVAEVGGRTYPVSGGVPILLADPARAESDLAQRASAMLTEYAGSQARSPIRSAYNALLAAVGDMRTPQADAAFRSIFADLPPDALCLSVGGGPTRVHSELVNLNIGLFPNVDLVADAYALPYDDGCVDAVHCEAVLEHLEFPRRAVAEMFRVLRPGRLLFAATPFLQPFHGYPDHFQNFTLTGHTQLFARAGFALVSSGTCVGPTFALRDLAVNYLRTVLPASIGRAFSRAASLLLLPLLYLDRLANRLPASANIASTTFLLAQKPVG